MATPPASAAISYLALGDSYTIGEGAAAADRWPVQLAALARAQGLPLAAPTIIARTGWTTAELQDAIRASGNHQTYGLVSLLIGVNNQYRGQSVALYRAELRALLATATAFAGGQARHVVVLAIPDWGQTPFAEGRDRAQIAAEIDQFNQVAHEECQHADVAFVAITPRTRAAAGGENQFTADGLHYTGHHMRGWAAQALPVVAARLR
ncbi:MAG: SGNH/GDSL hydrolase family protein [Cytophagaceae bacterium]|nr:MAG: SGNH/GDSL hydrolase family protein [Cytophagaceae bacterium]